ncbi:MAG: carbonic anhydrase, partial [Nitriliruptoraceae bacterium]
RQRFGVDAVDVVTEPGVDATVPALVDDLARRLAPSLEKHGSTAVVLAGHEDCAGNPVDEATHRQHLATSAGILTDTLGTGVEVLTVYVRLDGSVEVVG